MDFEGQYLTYNEYQELGGTLDQAPFNLLEFGCRKEIDENTQCRLKQVDNIPFDVKICMFNLINRIEKYNEAINKANDGVESENIDGYSVKYITPTQIDEIIKSKKAEITSEIKTQLFGVIVNNEHLIYLGVNND